ncbi:MAG TPA: glycosyltransferase [Thermoanaerobaculia bacterium]|nr:glycosyltransferase [Thermoanaerobaculia bacterium]
MISAVFVSYRSAALAERAIATFRGEARRTGREAEVIVVVNSGDGAERDALVPHADRVLLPPRNLGFAGGLNAGIAAARGGTLLLANPDLLFCEGSVAALADAAEAGGILAAGPALYADGARSVLLPPAEEGRPEELVRRALAADPARAARVFRRDARRAAVQAERAAAGESAAVRALSGALVAVTRAALEAVGPFDEAYPLYYEENDWQRRLLVCGGRLVHVGGAHVVHLFAQSTKTEPRVAAWFEESEQRYYAKHFGEAGRRGPPRLASCAPFEAPPLPVADRLSWDAPALAAVAISPFRHFRPFALALVPPGERRWTPPADLVAAHAGEALFVRAFARATGATLAEARLAG